MITFPEISSLPLLQKYVDEKCQERGFNKAEDLETYLLLTEEIGEMAKAIRKKRRLFTAEDVAAGRKAQDQLAEEMADVLSYLLELANRFEIDLEKAFRDKEAINDTRSWT
ncbi:MAG: RS21-C6 protein [bacterium]|nr:RS21-C6 protein [bacterium]